MNDNLPLENDALPKHWKTPEQRVELGRTLRDMIDAGRNEVEVRRARWDKNRAYYLNTPPPRKKPWAGAADAHVPLVQPVIDSVVSSVCGTIFTQSPPFSAVTHETGDQDEVAERVTKFFIDEGKLARESKLACQRVGWAGASILKTCWDPVKAQVEYESIDPSAFVAYPFGVRDMNDALLLADEIFLTGRAIVAKQEKGEYFSDVVLSGGTTKADRRGNDYPSTSKDELQSSPLDYRDTLQPLYRTLFQHEGEWWYALVAYNDSAVLKISGYPAEYGRVWYTKMAITHDDDGLAPARSLANDLQSLQDQLNHAMNNLLDGADWNSRPALASNSAGLSRESFKQFKPGTHMKSRDLTKDNITFFNPQTDITAFLPIIQFIISRANIVARIDQMRQGGQLSSGTTATEAQYINTGTQTSIDDFIQTFGDGMCDVADFTYTLARVHLNEWIQKHAGYLKLDEQALQEMGRPVKFELTGKTIGSSPDVQLATVRTLLESVAAFPAAGVDVYELFSEMLANMERSGVTGAKGIQMPRDGQEFVPYIAEKLGLPPELVAQGFQTMVQAGQVIQENAMAGMEGAGGNQGVSGMGGNAAGGLETLLAPRV